MMTNIWEKFVNFLIFVINLAKRIRLFRPCTWRPDNPQQSQSPPQLQTIQLLQTNATHPTDRPSPRPGGGIEERPFSGMGVCFNAVGAALQALQVQTPKPLPMTFHWFCMALELSFLCVILSIYIRRRNQVASLVMDHAATFLGATAFMLAISMNFPTPFLEITMALYFIVIILIIVANLLMP